MHELIRRVQEWVSALRAPGTSGWHRTVPPPGPAPATERAQQRRQRRRALLLALEGIDIGPELIHGVRVGPGVPR
ncbi:hypothetical protein [Streptomyces sp. NPDC002851]